MLSSGSEPWLHRVFEDDRCEALKDASRFTDAELEELGVTRIQGGGVNNPNTYQIDSSPVDPDADTTADAVDIRQIPGH